MNNVIVLLCIILLIKNNTLFIVVVVKYVNGIYYLLLGDGPGPHRQIQDNPNDSQSPDFRRRTGARSAWKRNHGGDARACGPCLTHQVIFHN